MNIIWISLAVFAVMAIWQRKTLKRVLAAAGAQVSKLGRMAWRADPVAVYQAEVDKAADEIQEATGGLETYRAEVSRLERLTEVAEKDVSRLTARVKNFLTLGKEEEAASAAVELQRAQTTLAERKTSLVTYQESYQNNLKKVRFARQRIEDAKAKARKLDADLKLSRAEAETAKLAERFSVNTNSLEGLGEIEDEIQRQIDTNKGKSQVAHDLSADGLAQIEEQEMLQKVEASEVLAKMKAEMGIK